jgi:hypothetical protein
MRGLAILLQLVLVPIRVGLALLGWVAMVSGAVGAVGWAIQLMIGGSGGGPLAPATMLALSIAALPAGFLLVTLAHAGVDVESPPGAPATVPIPGQKDNETPAPASAGSTQAVPGQPRTAVRALVAPHEQTARLRRASASTLRRRPDRRPL